MDPTSTIIECPLLLLVQANVAAEHEYDFNAWYYHHVPALLEIPGYRWGRRYQGVLGDTKYLALYEIEDAAFLEHLIGPDADKRHPTANAEFAKFEQLQGVSDVRINIYQQLSGSHLGNPFLNDDLPLSAVMVDCAVPEKEAEFNAWYDRSHVPNLVQIPGYASGARFQLLDHPALEWLGMGPKYLALYEFDSLDCLPSLADPDSMRPEAKDELERWMSYGMPLVENMSWNVYRPIAKHWRLAD
jgi:antibiotic biosynthesis monooxygenase (ABM) superfamily enzyme